MPSQTSKSLCDGFKSKRIIAHWLFLSSCFFPLFVEIPKTFRVCTSYKKSIYKYANFIELSIIQDHCSCIYFHLSCLLHGIKFMLEPIFHCNATKKNENRPFELRFVDRNQSISRIIDQMSILVSRLSTVKKRSAAIKNGISLLSSSPICTRELPVCTANKWCIKYTPFDFDWWKQHFFWWIWWAKGIVAKYCPHIQKKAFVYQSDRISHNVFNNKKNATEKRWARQKNSTPQRSSSLIFRRKCFFYVILSTGWKKNLRVHWIHVGQRKTRIYPNLFHTCKQSHSNWTIEKSLIDGRFIHTFIHRSKLLRIIAICVILIHFDGCGISVSRMRLLTLDLFAKFHRCAINHIEWWILSTRACHT